MIFQRLAKYFNAAANPRVYGFMVLLAISVGYLGSNIFYWRAGKKYEKMMQEKDRIAEECALNDDEMDADVLVKMK